ncbi:MAG: MGH1-like glycoside hydrolase domain-containing protein, partial [Thermomicrobiales bacterium]
MVSPATAAHVRQEAARILAQNRRTGHAAWNDQDYAYVVPSPGSYPFQWFWDSCFHAIALTHVNLDWAREELITLLHGALPSGLIPHQLLWEKDRY